MRIVGIVVCLAIAIASGWALFTGSDLLDADLPFAFPAGNLVAAVMLVATAAIPVLVDAPGPKRRVVAKATLAMAIAWLPFSMALAGGMQLSYSGWRSWAWIVYTLALLLAILLALGWAAFGALLSRRKAPAAR